MVPDDKNQETVQDNSNYGSHSLRISHNVGEGHPGNNNSCHKQGNKQIVRLNGELEASYSYQKTGKIGGWITVISLTIPRKKITKFGKF